VFELNEHSLRKLQTVLNYYTNWISNPS
jgi:hypothetical protein